MKFWTKKHFRREETLALPPPKPEGQRLAEQARAADRAKYEAEQATVAHFNKCWQETGRDV